MERTQYAGWFSENIYPLARTYAKNNPVEGVERDDYVQELVTMVWDKLEAFDPAKSNLTTFAFLWFRNVRWRLTDREMNRSKYITWADVEDSDGNVRNACEDAPSQDDPSASYSAEEEFGMLSPLAVPVIAGYSVKAVAKALGITAEEAGAMLADDLKALREALEEE